MIETFFKGLLVVLFIIFIVFGIILSFNCYKSETIMSMPGYCALFIY